VNQRHGTHDARLVGAEGEKATTEIVVIDGGLVIGTALLMYVTEKGAHVGGRVHDGVLEWSSAIVGSIQALAHHSGERGIDQQTGTAPVSCRECTHRTCVLSDAVQLCGREAVCRIRRLEYQRYGPVLFGLLHLCEGERSCVRHLGDAGTSVFTHRIVVQ